jgi:hypothetical protein
MSVPIFDHNKEAGISNQKDRVYLTQNGHNFTFAVYDKKEKRFKPEPRYVPPGLLTQDDMRGKFDDLLFRCVELERSMREMRGHVTNNLDQFIEREEAYWAVERTKLDNEVERLTAANKELEDQLFEAQTEAEKFKEDAKTYAAQLQVYEKTIAKYQENKENVADKRGGNIRTSKL